MIVLLIYCALVALLLLSSICLEIKRKPIFGSIKFMDRQHTEVIKGIAIICVVLSQIGNANRTRLSAPGGVLV